MSWRIVLEPLSNETPPFMGARPSFQSYFSFPFAKDKQIQASKEAEELRRELKKKEVSMKVNFFSFRHPYLRIKAF